MMSGRGRQGQALRAPLRVGLDCQVLSGPVTGFNRSGERAAERHNQWRQEPPAGLQPERICSSTNPRWLELKIGHGLAACLLIDGSYRAVVADDSAQMSFWR